MSHEKAIPKVTLSEMKQAVEEIESWEADHFMELAKKEANKISTKGFSGDNLQITMSLYNAYIVGYAAGKKMK